MKITVGNKYLNDVNQVVQVVGTRYSKARETVIYIGYNETTYDYQEFDENGNNDLSYTARLVSDYTEQVTLTIPKPLLKATDGDIVWKFGKQGSQSFTFNSNSQKHLLALAVGRLFKNEKDCNAWYNAMKENRG